MMHVGGRRNTGIDGAFDGKPLKDHAVPCCEKLPADAGDHLPCAAPFATRPPAFAFGIVLHPLEK